MLSNSQFLMDNWANFCSRSFIDKITLCFTGNTYKNFSIIKVNSENLALNGDLYFLNNFNAWGNHIICNKHCANILQHFAHINGTEKSNVDADIAKKVFDQLISESNRWPIRIQQCTLQKEKVCLYLNRADTIPNAIKMAVEYGVKFGRMFLSDEGFSLRYQIDAQSELTTHRLRLMRDITAKILNLHGYRYKMSDEDCVGKYIFTTKSEGTIDDGCEKYICGVVRNSQSNTKETCLTWKQYVKRKTDQLINLNKRQFLGDKKNTEKDIANAIVIFELLTVKPSRSVIIENDNFENKTVTNTKGASFILYNTARIASIIAKYNEKVSHGDYPNLPNIRDIDFSQLHKEDEWELIYNFIFGYPQMVKDCLKFEPNFQIHPHIICLFLSRLCQKFSIYYRKVRILTEGNEHLIPKMFARLYMLHALRVVLENALDIFDIKPMSQM